MAPQPGDGRPGSSGGRALGAAARAVEPLQPLGGGGGGQPSVVVGAVPFPAVGPVDGPAEPREGGHPHGGGGGRVAFVPFVGEEVGGGGGQPHGGGSEADKLVPFEPRVPFATGMVPFGQGTHVPFPLRARSAPLCGVPLANAPPSTNAAETPSTVVAIAAATIARFVFEFIGVRSWENDGPGG
jgi:hypothetical protein